MMRKEQLLKDVNTLILFLSDKEKSIKEAENTGLDVRVFFDNYENSDIAEFIKKLVGPKSDIYQEYLQLADSERKVSQIINGHIKLLKKMRKFIRAGNYDNK